MIERLRYLEPSQEFRSLWQYQNLMFLTAGYLAGQVAGTTWENLVEERIFGPLDMTGSNFSVDDSQKTADFSYPYAENGGVVERIPFRNIDKVGPAGSINSSVEEMIRYVQLHLDMGKAGEDRLTLSVPGQPTYELVPSQGMAFDLESVSGYSIEFKEDTSGAIAEMVLHQPNGTFVATRK